jgi:hypothetical protein
MDEYSETACRLRQALGGFKHWFFAMPLRFFSIRISRSSGAREHGADLAGCDAAEPFRGQMAGLLMAASIGLASCSQEVEYTDQQRACIAHRYNSYDARKLDQCLDVCKTCMNGNAVTCNTSCKLRGAS